MNEQTKTKLEYSLSPILVREKIKDMAASFHDLWKSERQSGKEIETLQYSQSNRQLVDFTHISKQRMSIDTYSSHPHINCMYASFKSHLAKH